MPNICVVCYGPFSSDSSQLSVSKWTDDSFKNGSGTIKYCADLFPSGSRRACPGGSWKCKDVFYLAHGCRSGEIQLPKSDDFESKRMVKSYSSLKAVLETAGIWDHLDDEVNLYLMCCHAGRDKDSSAVSYFNKKLNENFDDHKWTVIGAKHKLTYSLNRFWVGDTDDRESQADYRKCADNETHGWFRRESGGTRSLGSGSGGSRSLTHIPLGKRITPQMRDEILDRFPDKNQTQTLLESISHCETLLAARDQLPIGLYNALKSVLQRPKPQHLSRGTTTLYETDQGYTFLENGDKISGKTITLKDGGVLKILGEEEVIQEIEK